MILVNAAAIAFTVFFIHVTTWEGHIFEKQADWLKENLPELVTKPMFECPVCMSPWWGMAIQGFFYVTGAGVFSSDFFIMILTTFVAGGINVLNVIAAKFYDKMTDES